jgi:hypothetical protein
MSQELSYSVKVSHPATIGSDKSQIVAYGTVEGLPLDVVKMVSEYTYGAGEPVQTVGPRTEIVLALAGLKPRRHAVRGHINRYTPRIGSEPHPATRPAGDPVVNFSVTIDCGACERIGAVDSAGTVTGGQGWRYAAKALKHATDAQVAAAVQEVAEDVVAYNLTHVVRLVTEKAAAQRKERLAVWAEAIRKGAQARAVKQGGTWTEVKWGATFADAIHALQAAREALSESIANVRNDVLKSSAFQAEVAEGLAQREGDAPGSTCGLTAADVCEAAIALGTESRSIYWSGDFNLSIPKEEE